jgi:hypothetical protein
MEYEQKLLLPPPFIMISHVYHVGKFFHRKWRGEEKVDLPF